MDARRELESLEQVERSALGPRDARRLDLKKQRLRKQLGIANPMNNTSKLPRVLEALGDGEMSITRLSYLSGVGLSGIRIYIKAGKLEVVGYMPATGDYKQRNRKGPAVVRRSR